MDSSTNSVLAGMNLRNQILSLAISSLKAAAETIGFQASRARVDAPICPMIAQSSIVRPDDCTPIELLPIISLDTVAEHDHEDDCWVILYDLIYDLTDFIREHPGGAEVLLEHAGRDATLAFRGVGHSKQALLSMEKMIVGVLPEEERLYLRPTRTSIFQSPGLIELQPEAL